MTKQLHEFYVTRKCTKMEYFTVMAESMEDAKYEAEEGYDYKDFDWEEFDYETVSIEEQEIPVQQLTLPLLNQYSLSTIIVLYKGDNPDAHLSR